MKDLLVLMSQAGLGVIGLYALFMVMWMAMGAQ